MTTPTLEIDADLCRKDGLCATVCPARIFHWEKGAVPTIEHPDLCGLCGQCLAVCPGDTIIHSVLDGAAFEELDRHAALDEEQLYTFIQSRRSVRAYRDRDIPPELLERVARSAGFAPTGAFGGKGWVRQVVIVSGKEAMDEIAALTVAYMDKLRDLLEGFVVRMVAKFSEEANAGRMTLPDLAMRLEEWEAGRNVITYDAPAAIFVHTDMGTTTPHEDTNAALMNILLSSHALGLGACWNGWLAHAATGAHVSHFSALQERLGLPDANRVVQAATLGWPRVHLHKLPQRETAISWVK